MYKQETDFIIFLPLYMYKQQSNFHGPKVLVVMRFHCPV